MPHDRNGTEIKVGDRIFIEAEVISLTTSDDYCNATVKTVYPMPPYTEGTSITLNTRQLFVPRDPAAYDESESSRR